MRQGKLRVLLGAAPGVGKTYTMLEEGKRLASLGKDVVIAVVETHGRAATLAMTAGLETIPRRVVEYRGVELTELDVGAVLTRAPQVALVDELAHTNAPGSRHEKRWRDVDTLLDAGIDVISTVNIQHIESLNDVVQQITGVPQRETVPDAVLRGADQIEVIDLAPQSLRDRLSAGLVYPTARIDAALSNYFRLGNLTALRELALLWLADEVDSSLRHYRAQHDIGSKWEARERVVVALTGGPEGDTLIRRGGRIAARSAGGQLLAVHVTSQDGLRSSDPEALARQRSLVESLGGSYHQVVGADIPEALVEFARASNATQLVIGVSRRSRLAALLTGPGIGATVVRESGDIDVHIVTHSAAGNRFSLPTPGGSLTVRRRVLGLALALVLGPLLTLVLTTFRSDDSITSDVLSYQLLVVVVALVGGIWPALFAALLSGVTLDFFFVEPLYTVTIAEPLHALAIVLYVVIAVLVSVVVDQAARRTRAARRSAAESELIASIAGQVLGGADAPRAFVERARRAFGLTAVQLLREQRVIAEDGDSSTAAAGDTVAVNDDTTLQLYGRTLSAGDRRLLGVIATQLAAALEQADLQRTASQMVPLAAADRVRTALLSAVGHDLRRPLAAATAAVTGLRSAERAVTSASAARNEAEPSAGGSLSPADREELFDTAETGLRQLAELLTDLLDVGRLQAGALAVRVEPVAVDDVVPAAMEELGIGPGSIEVDIPADLPEVSADPVLLERILVNLLSNALKYSPAEQPAVIAASALGKTVEIRVIDRGPGVPENRRDDIFVPFQRLGDTDNTTGLGLGLALSKGFAEGMDGALEFEETPLGGSTLVLSLSAVGP